MEELKSKVNPEQIKYLIGRLKDLANHLAFSPTHPFPVSVQGWHRGHGLKIWR